MRVSLMMFSFLVAAGAQADPDLAAQARIEQQALSANAPIARRDGNALLLTLATKSVARLNSVPSCAGPEDCLHYHLMGMSPDRQFFDVAAQAYESATRFWISRASGQRVEVYAEPHASPDRKYIVSANPVEFGGTNGVFVWEVERGELRERFRSEPSDHRLYGFVRWVDASTVQLAGADGACPAKLSRRHGRWKLTTDATVSCKQR
ncbi:hypothetical protein Q4S45_17275 [Massilia sp. R2A-15]|uniref:hypothetical protein n=1 Tax=Massilia sp. R2A-15 TaxID=3064278 RepID=UPI002736162F|nr:hypothetical protein [Massilia sp. R2A-15]WLI88465.1 hypothetical protein Q4S45_17275 [Massilia sp. R2A-15]